MRLLISLIFLPPLFLIISCVSTSKKDLKTDREQEHWLHSYLQSKENLDCDAMTVLSKKTDFILKDLAIIRAHMICTETTQLPELSENTLLEKNYLQALNSERVLIEAEKSKDPKRLALALKTKALQSRLNSEKTSLLEQALSYSQKAQEEELSNELTERLYKAAPRKIPQPQPEDYFRVATDYLYQRDFKTARNYLNKIASNPKIFKFEEIYQANKSIRNSYKTEQSKKLYLEQNKHFTQWLVKNSNSSNDFKKIHEAYVTWARTAWTQGKKSEAEKILNLVEKKLDKKYPLDEVYFIRGRMAEESKDFKQALQFYEIASRESPADSIISKRIEFSKAWMLRKVKNYEQAAIAFLKLKTESTDPFDRYRFQFWLAKSYQQSGLAEQSLAEYHLLRQEDTLGYYGLLAHKELNLPLPALESRKPAADSSSSFESKMDADTQSMILALTMAKEESVLEKYLDEKTKLLSSQSTKDPAIWLNYLKAYAHAGLYLPLFAQLGLLDADIKNQLLKNHPELLFPKKYDELIKASALQYSVYPELIFSIMRQESAFNPEARSPADAFGLMQILPGVAKEHQKITGISITQDEDLFKPEINIPIGSSILAKLSKKYKGQFILTAAAYNANEQAIQNWLNTRLESDPLEFIEDIPYDETKSYVKLVLRNFIYYSRLSKPFETMPFPEWCLENLQSFKVSTR